MNPVIANTIIEIGGFPITDSIVGIVLLDLIILGLIALVSLSLKPASETPSKIQAGFEVIYEGIRDFMKEIAGDEKVTLQIMPMIFTIVVYIFISNSLLTIPILESLRVGGENPLVRIPTSDLSIVVGLALVVVFNTHVLAISKKGPITHFHGFLPIGTLIKTLITNPKEAFIKFIETFVALLDIVGEFSKVISLSMRLFGNILSGQIIGAMLFTFFGLLLPVPLILYGLFTGILQAIVFGALSASYYAGFLTEYDDEN